MNFEGCTPQAIPRFGSLVQWDAAVQLPLGVAQIARNAAYRAESAKTRYGLSTRLGVELNNPISGIGAVRYLAPDASNQEIIELLALTQNDGDLYSYVPFLPASKTKLTTPAFLAQANYALAPGSRAVIEQCANRAIVSITDLVVGSAPGLIYDPDLGTVDVLSDLPFADPWKPAKRYRAGQVVSPSEFQTFGLLDSQGQWTAKQTGFVYRCTTGGISAADDPAHDTQPAWPETIGATGINDGTCVWEEYTPIALTGLPDPAAPNTPTSTPQVGTPIVPGATVYLACTYTNAQGEGINELVAPFGPNVGQIDPNRVLVWKNNTAASVKLSVTLPTIPAIFGTAGTLGAQFGAQQLNLYVLIVTGTPNPEQITDPSFYALAPGGPFDAGTVVDISTWTAGQELPTVNTAILNLTAGNIPTGVRYGLVLFETRTVYQTGWSNSAPIRINVTQSSQQLTVLRSPTGPYNAEAVVWAFTVAGASAAGPYTYVDQADTQSPGFNLANVNITATRIPNNTTITTVFNFTDTYLPGASDVTDYADRIEIPPFVDVHYSKTLQAAIYSGAQGYPSTLLISDTQDMEAIRIPGSNLDVAINDGDRVICYREVRNIGIAFKENSGHVINANDGDASTWAADELWRGMGPVGPKAVDVSADDESQFAIFAHRTGLYLYTGTTPRLISREIYQWWDLIDWSNGCQIVVKIDQKHREIRIAAPMLDGSRLTFTMNYFFGMGDPVVFSTRRGLIPNVEGRKWSVDDIAAEDMLYVPQRSASEAQQVGVDIRNEMIFACTDGAIKTVTEGQYWDEGFVPVASGGAKLGYLSEWLSVPGSNPKLAVFGLAGASMSAIGNGHLNVYAITDAGKQVPLSTPQRAWILSATESQRDFGASAGREASRWGIGFDNGAVPGAWWEVHTAILWIFQKWTQRAG